MGGECGSRAPLPRSQQSAEGHRLGEVRSHPLEEAERPAWGPSEGGCRPLVLPPEDLTSGLGRSCLQRSREGWSIHSDSTPCEEQPGCGSRCFS